MTGTSTSTPTHETLDARYGRTADRRRGRRILGVVAAVGVVAVTGAWVVWAGLLSPAADLELRTLGYGIPDERHVTVNWELTVAPGADASCAVQALDERHGVVGWSVVEIPASTDRTRAFEQSLRTSAPAVTGLIYRCWLT